ncbi:hypothetical protein BJ508DRAFT_310910 [Ascobolus immersus RN42]|uniref:Uncharacterized protein n=1 Tax=Ascobolus immersus RN42 TaxID=1160509 RepID=A0A3N4HXL7_ASCIM|nr:hypothetical protein BJ508DRAFT_310910 [Ascobolus immersus RN42]
MDDMVIYKRRRWISFHDPWHMARVNNSVHHPFGKRYPHLTSSSADDSKAISHKQTLNLALFFVTATFLAALPLLPYPTSAMDLRLSIGNPAISCISSLRLQDGSEPRSGHQRVPISKYLWPHTVEDTPIRIKELILVLAMITLSGISRQSYLQILTTLSAIAIPLGINELSPAPNCAQGRHITSQHWQDPVQRKQRRSVKPQSKAA